MKAISTPPKFVFTANDRPHLPPPNGTTARASTPKSRGRPRGTSPAKNTSPAKQSTKKPRATKAAKEADAASAREASASLQATLEDYTPHKARTIQKEQNPEPSDDKSVEIHVKHSVATKGDDERKETTFVEFKMPEGFPQLPVPERPEEVIETAKAMVEEDIKQHGESSSSKAKRKAEEMDPESDGSADNEVQPAKRARLLEKELKKEKVRTRALLGVAATLVIGYVHMRLHGLILSVADIKDRAIIPLVLPG